MPIAQQPARKFSAYQNNYYQNSKEDKDNNYRYRDVNKSYTRSFSIYESSMPLKYTNKYVHNSNNRVLYLPVEECDQCGIET